MALASTTDSELPIAPELIRPLPQPHSPNASSSSPLPFFLANQTRQSENRRNSLSFGGSLLSIWYSDPRLRSFRPGRTNWKGGESGRFAVDRCKDTSERVCAWVWREVLSEDVTRHKVGQPNGWLYAESTLDLLFDTRSRTRPSLSYSAPSFLSSTTCSVHPLRSFNNSRYLGHLCTIVNIQSLNLSLPHWGWDSCLARNSEKGFE